MGQYYKPTILAKNKKTVVKWMYSHDYGNGLKLMEHSWIKNGFVSTFESLIFDNPQHIVWAGDYADECKRRKSNIFDRCTQAKKIHPDEVAPNFKYIINHTKKEFVDKTKGRKVDGWQIHPLPLLTCEGNGRGGGDFRGESDLIGSWARDEISVSNIKPLNFKELKFNLVE